ncbi:hypothetical protein TIFTF001_016020 [Ficus carica]|uniref:Uncharacterized protein n=1 Tax=Ficus carica TaxID=3494 RepID=A0AA88ASV6_FICCA|nr:hypothetical protein TIFTF001_016020 [Ficus carica]
MSSTAVASGGTNPNRNSWGGGGGGGKPRSERAVVGFEFGGVGLSSVGEGGRWVSVYRRRQGWSSESGIGSVCGGRRGGEGIAKERDGFSVSDVASWGEEG